MPDNLRVAYHSERGRRATNEDMYAVPALPADIPFTVGDRGLLISRPQRAQFARKGYLFMVGDGVGGYEGGELASRNALEDIAGRYYADPSPELGRSLQRVIEAANRRLCSLRGQPQMPSRMATTVIAALIHQQSLFVAGVGDSRAYLLRDGQCYLLTGDHSPRLPAGDLTGQDGAGGHLITRSLGSRVRVGVDTWEHALQAGDRVLLCTDGVSGHLSSEELGRLGSQEGLQRAVNALIDNAYDAGSRDNMTVTLIEWQGRESNG